jgi:hypothetical protein
LPVEESSGSLGDGDGESVIFEEAPESGESVLIVMCDSESCKCGDVINSVIDFLTGSKIAKALIAGLCLSKRYRSKRLAIDFVS